ncbi:MAG: hypothetical protein GY820_10930 [Gammaproteobacteria bacterium]|nr:hypothetical protein [Gammaproteobacteria bacterium]
MKLGQTFPDWATEIHGPQSSKTKQNRNRSFCGAQSFMVRIPYFYFPETGHQNSKPMIILPFLDFNKILL